MSKAPAKKKSKQTGTDELVLTPGGWRPKSKVHHVQPGQHIDGTGGRLRIIETATGKVVKDLGEIAEAEPAKPKKRRSDAGTSGKKKKPG